MTKRISSPITLTQIDDDALVRGTGFEIGVHDGGDHPTLYLVGSAADDGTTVIIPCDARGESKGLRWLLADHTVLDAVEELQTLIVCDRCDGSGTVEAVDPVDGALVTPEDCDDCDGEGWR